MKNTAESNKELMLAFLKALNDLDYKAARTYASDDLKFEGVLGSRDGADAYFSDMERMQLKYDIKKVVADGDDVCLLFDVAMGGKTILSSGWYNITNGKLNSIRVIFDPRPLLESSDKK